jgi:hypothetical protein
MKLMRLVRERFHSQIAGDDAPVKAKEAPPSRRAPCRTPVTPARRRTPRRPPPTPRRRPRSPAAISMRDALAVMVDPAARRSRQRASAPRVPQGVRRGIPLADVAMAGMLVPREERLRVGPLLRPSGREGPSGETKYAGRLEKRSDTSRC